MVERRSPPPPPLLRPPGPCACKLGMRISGKGYFLSSCTGNPLDCPLFHGNGSWGNGLAVVGIGTGSKPPRPKGWQRRTLPTAIIEPLSGPCTVIASCAYSEQVGTNLHPSGLNECRAGESQRR